MASLRHDPWILVVEDDVDLRRLLTVTLGKLGPVVAAGNGAEAATLLGSRPPPVVVVTDVMMPGGSGLDLLRTLRTEPRYRSVPVVVLSAKSDPRSIVDGINAGARHYVTKPFKTGELLAKVERLVLRGMPPAALPSRPTEEEELELELVPDE